MSSIWRSAPDPNSTILLTSTKWWNTSWFTFLQVSFALFITLRKLRHSEYPSSEHNSLALQHSISLSTHETCSNCENKACISSLFILLHFACFCFPLPCKNNVFSIFFLITVEELFLLKEVCIK